MRILRMVLTSSFSNQAQSWQNFKGFKFCRKTTGLLAIAFFYVCEQGNLDRTMDYEGAETNKKKFIRSKQIRRNFKLLQLHWKEVAPVTNCGIVSNIVWFTCIAFSSRLKVLREAKIINCSYTLKWSSEGYYIATIYSKVLNRGSSSLANKFTLLCLKMRLLQQEINSLTLKCNSQGT